MKELASIAIIVGAIALCAAAQGETHGKQSAFAPLDWRNAWAAMQFIFVVIVLAVVLLVFTPDIFALIVYRR